MMPPGRTHIHAPACLPPATKSTALAPGCSCSPTVMLEPINAYRLPLIHHFSRRPPDASSPKCHQRHAHILHVATMHTHGTRQTDTCSDARSRALCSLAYRQWQSSRHCYLPPCAANAPSTWHAQPAGNPVPKPSTCITKRWKHRKWFNRAAAALSTRLRYWQCRASPCLTSLTRARHRPVVYTATTNTTAEHAQPLYSGYRTKPSSKRLANWR